MSTEELIREIISKICPFHGKHPTIELQETGQVNISACCEAFREQCLTIVNLNRAKAVNKLLEKQGPNKIMKKASPKLPNVSKGGKKTNSKESL